MAYYPRDTGNLARICALLSTNDQTLMERHPYFDLWLHSTQEPSEQLSIDVIERSTLHEWPLSCVQRLQWADGTQLIYKSQLQDTTVEPAFYTAIQTDTVLSALQSPLALNHGDLGGDNVFVASDGYKFIDWQCPVYGPAELDRVAYLTAMGINPLKYIDRGVVGLFWFLSLRWFTECKARWFPPGESYDHQVAALAEQIIQFSL